MTSELLRRPLFFLDPPVDLFQGQVGVRHLLHPLPELGGEGDEPLPLDLCLDDQPKASVDVRRLPHFIVWNQKIHTLTAIDILLQRFYYTPHNKLRKV